MDTCIMWRMYLLDSLWKFKAILIVTSVIAGIAGVITLAIWHDNQHHADAPSWFKWGRRLVIWCPIGIIVGLLMPTGEELTGYKDRVQQYRERRQHEIDLDMREERLKLEMQKLGRTRLELTGLEQAVKEGK